MATTMTEGSLPPLPPPPPGNGLAAGQRDQVAAALGLPPKDAPAPEPGAEPLKSISPGPVTNNPVFENRVTPVAAKDTTAGQNASSSAHAFEQRVVPQDGQH